MILDVVLLVLVLVSIILTCVLFVYERRGRALLYALRSQLETSHQQQMANTWATVSLHKALGGLKAPLPAAGGWALGSDTLACVHAMVVHAAPRCVVELGSGLSTVVLADALRKGQGRLIAVESDARYLELTRQLLDDAGLAASVTLVHAPLEAFDAGEPEWYGKAALADIEGVDMLLVDGPPATECPTVRYPALPFFRARLNAGARVILDDCDRPGELQVLARWQQEFDGLQVRMLPLGRPLAQIDLPQRDGR